MITWALEKGTNLYLLIDVVYIWIKADRFVNYNYKILLYRHKCFTGKYCTHKIHKNYIQDPSGLFSTISHVSLSMM